MEDPEEVGNITVQIVDDFSLRPERTPQKYATHANKRLDIGGVRNVLDPVANGLRKTTLSTKIGRNRTHWCDRDKSLIRLPHLFTR